MLFGSLVLIFYIVPPLFSSKDTVNVLISFFFIGVGAGGSFFALYDMIWQLIKDMSSKDE